VSTQLLTLQDHDVRLLAPDDLLARSPGFASIAQDAPLFGESARAQARLHPRQSFNQFWAQLSLDPLPLKNKHFRHAADLAHGHLKSLTQGLHQQDTVIAVPSNYTRNQLAVLLGIMRSCEVPVSGLVDLALLQAMASDTQADTIIIVDLQLHQAVLSCFHRVNGQLQRDRVVQVPASGLLALQDAWTNLIADEFIRQTRFDPKHNAEVEQYLYNQLDSWIEASRAGNELLIELNHKGSVHQARIGHDAFGPRARLVFERIRKELEPLRTPNTAVQLLRSQLQLPGLALHLPGLIALDDGLLLDSYLSHAEHIHRPADQLQLVSRLPLHSSNAVTASPAPVRLPSHVLLGARALALPLGVLRFADPAQHADGSARVLPLDSLPPGAVLSLQRTRTQLLLEHAGIPALTVNGSAAQQGMALQLGDRIQLGDAGPQLLLIQVE